MANVAGLLNHPMTCGIVHAFLNLPKALCAEAFSFCGRGENDYVREICADCGGQADHPGTTGLQPRYMFFACLLEEFAQDARIFIVSSLRKAMGLNRRRGDCL